MQTLAIEEAAPVAAKKKMPTTREDFRLAANWLARKALGVGNAAVEFLWPSDDPEMGIKRGYLDDRDRK